MNRIQIDKWFSLSDRVDLLISRRKITPADAPNLLTPIRELEDHSADRSLSIAELEISKVERSGFLVGSAESLAVHQAKERSDAFFASRSKR